MNKNTKIIVSSLIIIAILAGGYFTIRQVANHPDATSIGPKKTAEEQAQDTQKKSETIDTSNDPNKTTYSPPANNDGITISPSQPSATQVVVATKLTGYSDGSCTLVATNGSKTTTQTAQIIYQSEFSTCAGFTIETSVLGSGTWTLDLSTTSGGKIVSKSATLEVK